MVPLLLVVVGGGEWGAGVCGEGGSARVDEWESAGLQDV